MRNLTKLAGLACASSLLTLGAQEDLGFTDLRLNVGLNPTGSIGGGKYGYWTGDFDDGMRISVMAIGPLCNLTPVGCGTPPRLRKSVAGKDSSIDYIEGIAGDDFADFGNASYTYDLLMGLELSHNTWSRDGQTNMMASVYGPYVEDLTLLALLGGTPPIALPAPLTFNNYILQLAGLSDPAIDLEANALTLHFGWGFEIDTRFSGVWHIEFLGFGGAGLAEVDWTDTATGVQETDEGLYVEIGGSLGTYYTHPFGIPGLQLGLHGGAAYQKASISAFSRRTDLSVSGFQGGASVGFRF
jgi:hypothetical protein